MSLANSADHPQSHGHLPAAADRTARNLTAHRERLGLTQAQLAKQSRISRATIALIESGQADPKLSTLKLLAGALSINVTDLIE